MKQLTCLSFVAVFLYGTLLAQKPSDLDEAVAMLRSIKRSDSIEEAEASAKRFQVACETIQAAGEEGARRLDAELSKVTGDTDEDDLFRLFAGDLIFEIQGIEAAQRIAEVWSKVKDKRAAEATFFTAAQAARSQDARAIPLLKFSLAATDSVVFIPDHSLTLGWPQTVELLWNSCGQACIGELRKMLWESKVPAEIGSATHVLCRTLDADLLPRIREIAQAGTGVAKLQAIKALGWYGHPDDFELLRAGLKSSDKEVVFHSLFALIDYGDLRAAQDIAPLRESTDEKLRGEAIQACTYLATRDSIDWLVKEAAPKENEANWELQGPLSDFLERLKLTPAEYRARDVGDREKLVADAVAKGEESYGIKPGQNPMTHEELVRRLRSWTANGRLPELFKVNTVLAASTPDDIPLLLGLRSRLYHRLSDECLYEIQKVEKIIQRLGRSRYRKAVGITDRVEAVAQ